MWDQKRKANFWDGNSLDQTRYSDSNRLNSFFTWRMQAESPVTHGLPPLQAPILDHRHSFCTQSYCNSSRKSEVPITASWGDVYLNKCDIYSQLEVAKMVPETESVNAAGIGQIDAWDCIKIPKPILVFFWPQRAEGYFFFGGGHFIGSRVLSKRGVWKFITFNQLVAVSQKRCKIGARLLYDRLIGSRIRAFRLVPKSSTLDDLERPKRTRLQKRCVFWSQP